MKSKDIGYWFILIFFVMVGALSWRVYFKNYQQSDSVSIHEFPKVIGEWVSEEIPISDDDKALLETDNVFVRRYTNTKEEEVFLFVVYSQNNRKVSHPPEICYTGGGATILSSVKDSFVLESNLVIDVNRLKVERGRVTQIFAYWFKVGNSFTSNYWKQQVMIAHKSLLGQDASSALIRISSTVNHGVDSEATAIIKKFGQKIIPLLQQYLP